MLLNTTVAIFGIVHGRDIAWNFKLDATGESFVKLASQRKRLVCISPDSMLHLLAESTDILSCADRLINVIQHGSRRIPAYVIFEARRFVVMWLDENWKVLRRLKGKTRPLQPVANLHATTTSTLEA